MNRNEKLAIFAGSLLLILILAYAGFILLTDDLEDFLHSPDGSASVDEIEELEQPPYDVEFGRGSGELEYDNTTIDVDDKPFMGEEDAENVLVSYEDFFCPFCVGFHNEEFAQQEGMNSAFNQIVESHVETGEAKFYMKMYPVAGGVEPAEYAECISAEGSAEDYYTFSYNHFSNWEDISPMLTEERHHEYQGIIETWVQQLEVDSSDVQSCLNQGTGNERLNQTLQEVESMDEEFGTPATFVNGELVEGAHPYNSFEQHLN